MILGLSEREWKELKDQQREFNIIKSKIIDLVNADPQLECKNPKCRCKERKIRG
jgi:hypothetical protein